MSLVGVNYSTKTIFVIEKESDNILAYRLKNKDLCCCSECKLFLQPPWLRDQLMRDSYSNIEITITNVEDDPVDKIGRAILDVVCKRFESDIDILLLNLIKSVRVIRQFIPRINCKKTQDLRKKELFTRNKIKKLQTFTGLSIL